MAISISTSTDELLATSAIPTRWHSQLQEIWSRYGGPTAWGL